MHALGMFMPFFPHSPFPPGMLWIAGAAIYFIFAAGGNKRRAMNGGQASRACARCGAVHPPIAKFCRRCGQSLE